MSTITTGHAEASVQEKDKVTLTPEVEKCQWVTEVARINGKWETVKRRKGLMA
jgi:hypothetical protein